MMHNSGKKHAIGPVPEINENIAFIQIKHTHYSCIYLKYILYSFNKLNLKLFFNFILLEKWDLQLV
jgi:hypothetical protein